MKGNNLNQTILLPNCLAALVDLDDEVRIIDIFATSNTSKIYLTKSRFNFSTQFCPRKNLIRLIASKSVDFIYIWLKMEVFRQADVSSKLKPHTTNGLLYKKIK